jgi:hypothetical protein
MRIPLISTCTRSTEREKKYMAKVKVADRLMLDQEEKKEVVWEFYNNLLGTAREREFTLDLPSFHPGTQLDLEGLNQIITEEEVWNTIKSLPADKAPGPDGFTGRFYKIAWPIIKGDFMAAINRLMQGDVSRLSLLNSAYITLLPKSTEALELKDYRPISLIHSFAKIIMKLLANRLASKLPQLVSLNQSAFVKGRCIHDNFILVQQMAKVLHRQKEARILLKLDISKAFDSVSWPFLLEVLQFLGFGSFWCDIMPKMFRTASTRVLVNGEPGDLIFHQRGLRQGDPLSPMLFILVMDVLNFLIKRAADLGQLLPLLRRGAGQRVSMYVDDVVLFVQPVASELTLTK